MEIFLNIVKLFSHIPAWVPLLLLPALLFALAVLLFLTGGRGAYAPAACVLVALGTAFFACIGEGSAVLVYAALFAAEAGILRLALCLPRPARRTKGSREERIYQKFRGAPLAPPPAPEGQPAKVCCFEETPSEQPPELEHALSLLAKLRRRKLASADRLEADVLQRTLSALGNRPLTPSEKDTVNDCLASVLKLTAKYKL